MNTSRALRLTSGKNHIVHKSSIAPHPNGKIISSIMMNVATCNHRSVLHGCGRRGLRNHLDNEQLLANSSPQRLFRILYRAHGQDVHVDRQADRNQEVPENDRESLLDGAASQAHAHPPAGNPISSTADFLAEGREIWLNQSSKRAVKTVVQERVHWHIRGCRSFEGGDNLSESTMSERSQIRTVLIL